MLKPVQVTPSRAQYGAMAASAPLIPVWCEILCDGQTPVGVHARLRQAMPDRPRFLLESVVGGERWARYSFLGVGHRARLSGTWDGTHMGWQVEAGPGFRLPPGLASTKPREGLAPLEAALSCFRGPDEPGLPRFWGGIVGVWGHDLVRCFEHLPNPSHARDGLPAVEVAP